jgi:hypothetical protein
MKSLLDPDAISTGKVEGRGASGFLNIAYGTVSSVDGMESTRLLLCLFN